ncbi:MAG: M3 family metallopeptidase [Alistipes sp.]|nr:M3 family metallopeptidase [Alistipes sp.]
MKRFLRLFAVAIIIMTVCGCKKSTESGENPFFEAEWDTPYGAPPFDRIAFEHFKPAFERGMSLQNEEIATIVESKDEPTFENVILAYDNSGEMLSRVSRVFSTLNSAETNEQMQALSAELSPLRAAHSDAITLNERLFDKIKAVYDKRNALGLDAEQLRLTEKIYDGFVRSGALLSAEDKARLKQINEQLSALSVKFGQNLLAETNAFVLEVANKEDLKGVPETACDAAREQANKLDKGNVYAFTLQKPSMLPLLTYADNRNLREQIYKAYIARGNNDNENDNKSVIADIISLRYEKAKLLGFDTFADYVVSNQMAKTPEAVYELLHQVWEPALQRSKEELKRMTTMFKHENGMDAQFESWDWWYYAEKVRKADYDLEEEKVRQYLSLDNVKSGIFFLANRLYGITFRPLQAPLYHSECEMYEVIDNDDKPLGALCFDFHPRPGKRAGAWCGTMRRQSYKDGERVPPVVSIVCNFTRPAGGVPALLSLDETETLFHEFGHALHNLFADVKYKGLSGVEGDFVELPSQIMENWAFTQEMLKEYAVHYRTGEVMPDDMIERIQRSSKFNEGFATTELVAAALSDMDIHSVESADKIDVNAFEKESLVTKRGLISQIEPRYHYTYFNHIFNSGYSAGYYFYIWAEVLDKDAHRAFVESGDLFNRDVAERFRREILSRGGERDGMDMYRSFRGAEPDKTAMLVARGLVEEEDVATTEPMPIRQIGRVDTRAQARARAERSRQERAAARRADSLAMADSLARVEADAE